MAEEFFFILGHQTCGRKCIYGIHPEPVCDKNTDWLNQIIFPKEEHHHSLDLPLPGQCCKILCL